MALKATYDTQDEIPAAFHELYEERGGKWLLTGIEGIVTDADVARVQRALDNEKKAHTTTKEKLGGFGDLDVGERTVEEAQGILDGHDEMTARLEASGDLDETKLDQLVTTQVNKIRAPLDREIKNLTEANEGLTASNTELSSTITNGKIDGSIRTAGVEAKVVTTALDDVVQLGRNVFEVLDDGAIVTRDGVGVVPGIDAATWLSDMKDKRPHWWPASVGGGAGGGDDIVVHSDNPWTASAWNMTNQGKFLKDHGQDRAAAAAKAAGVELGAAHPAQQKQA